MLKILINFVLIFIVCFIINYNIFSLLYRYSGQNSLELLLLRDSYWTGVTKNFLLTGIYLKNDFAVSTQQFMSIRKIKFNLLNYTLSNIVLVNNYIRGFFKHMAQKGIFLT